VSQRRDSLAICVLSAYVLFKTLLHTLGGYGAGGLSETSAQMVRLGETAASLRALGIRGEEIGYVSDVALDSSITASDTETSLYYQLQYQLLPSVLVRSSRPSLVIGYLHDRANLGGILRQEHLALKADLGDGFFVLKHEAN
jgi:hypothetical protein